ncbi:AAA family ATPase [Rhodalgimonas zhirmunskyi]|uniref:AAA family ATPase n=1 Tax=Rhodalgimonas zhirmunskyi TaxID=2964767 RepID=A0AAJ1UBZ7_9RHOB|nr:AAA family ATPase [Rhodoalgimonas zhirmunskyi]MDQ2093776.1 AAA family ATPase [Rhodoalgimonas zhirmunskyi]
MTSEAIMESDLSPLVACTISRDVQNFDLLIEDMEAALGESWGDLGFAEAKAFFNQPEAEALEFVAIAIDESDEEKLVMLGEIIEASKEKGIKVILIAEDVSPAALHQLLRQGADEFVPYPLPEGELMAAIARLQEPEPEPMPMAAPVSAAASEGNRNGVLIAVHGLAGGTGATTLAVNLAWELCTIQKEDAPKVCIIDLDLQFGAVSTYLDLQRREAVYEMLTDTDGMDDDVFKQALVGYEDKLSVLTAPPEMLPLDLISSEDVNAVLDMARRHFDYVVVDMPSTLVSWSEAVLNAAHVYFATLELDMRSAQNTLRLKRALQAEELPVEKLRYALNRGPKFTDLSGKSRVKLLEESLDISIEVQLPDGGKPVVQAADHGMPLAEAAAKNPLRKEIAKLAASIHQHGQDEAQAA